MGIFDDVIAFSMCDGNIALPEAIVRTRPPSAHLYVPLEILRDASGTVFEIRVRFDDPRHERRPDGKYVLWTKSCRNIDIQQGVYGSGLVVRGGNHQVRRQNVVPVPSFPLERHSTKLTKVFTWRVYQTTYGYAVRRQPLDPELSSFGLTPLW